MFPKTPKVIAEIGQNHNGRIDLALDLVDMASKAGCYAVKSAKRSVKAFPAHWKTKPYHHPNSFGPTYYEHRKALELGDNEYENMRLEAKDKGMLFGSSFTDIDSLHFCVDINVDFLKIASSRVADVALLKEVALMNKPVLLSTGMSDELMIDQAIKILSPVPYLALLQCTSSYPTKPSDIHLNVIKGLKYHKLPLGFSCHGSINYACAALALGAEWFEYHITYNTHYKGTDHIFSLEPKTLQLLVTSLNECYQALSPITTKHILDCEKDTVAKLRDDLK